MPLFKKISQEDRPLLITRSQDEDAVEAVRSLYAQLKLGSRVDAPKTILITSVLPSEGKSFVASNLAGAFAAHGLKTLLMDTDLRRPAQHRAFGLVNDAGLLRWTNQKRTVPENALNDPDLGITSCAPNLYLLRTGGTTRRSTEFLDSDTIQGLLGALQKQFDIVIIDTPPAGIFPDALALAEHADEIIYVVRYNHVSRPAVRRIIEHISRTGIDQAGIVLNMMPTGRGSSAHYSSYGHYGSKYYEDYTKENKA
jgi:capsular exopolysaccharide synthesis family protein